MLEEQIELRESVDVAEDVRKRVKTTGVYGLDINKAKEMGVFNRISNLLCATHASIAAAYRIYSGVQYIMNDVLRARKNEIAHEMNLYERAYDRFIRFWTSYYANGVAGVEINNDTEALYHQIMQWAQIPETWQLGDKQRIEDKADTLIKVMKNDDVDLTFHKTTVDEELLTEIKESWCVTKYDVKERKQTSVNTNMDKASALMVAKRLSNEDKENIYTASLVQDIEERRTDVIPFKAFKADETIGTIRKAYK